MDYIILYYTYSYTTFMVKACFECAFKCLVLKQPILFKRPVQLAALTRHFHVEKQQKKSQQAERVLVRCARIFKCVILELNKTQPVVRELTGARASMLKSKRFAVA